MRKDVLWIFSTARVSILQTAFTTSLSATGKTTGNFDDEKTCPHLKCNWDEFRCSDGTGCYS